MNEHDHLIIPVVWFTSRPVAILPEPRSRRRESADFKLGRMSPSHEPCSRRRKEADLKRDAVARLFPARFSGTIREPWWLMGSLSSGAGRGDCALRGESRTCSVISTRHLAKRRTAILPLPPGAGRGEGALQRESRTCSIIPTRHLAKRWTAIPPLPPGEGRGEGGFTKRHEDSASLVTPYFP